MVSQLAGMGSIVAPGGTAFRVWAPFASAVAVAGDFNGWSVTDSPLEPEGDGCWSGDVTGAGPGHEYKFAITNRASGEVLLRRDPYGLAQTASNGNSIIIPELVAPGIGGYETPPWNEWVVYELHVGTFSRDPNTADGHGTFNSLVAHLDELAALGVNVLQLMPANEFPSDHSEGYNPCNLFAIDEDYGGVAGFLRLVAEAHARGLAVVMDVVYNHFGTSDLDLWRFDGWWENDGGGIYIYNDARAVTDWGDTRPDYGRPEVRQFLRDNVMFWCQTLGVDGLRWDAVNYIRNVRGYDNDPGGDLPEGWSLLQEVNAEVSAKFPWKLMIAEDMQDNPWVTRAIGAGGAGFGAQWGAGFLHGIRDVLLAPSDDARDVNQVRDVLLAGDDAPFGRVLYVESHDEVGSDSEPQKMRLPAGIDPRDPTGYFARKRAALGIVLTFTARGIPMIFQGQEFLATEPFEASTPLDRRPAARDDGFEELVQDVIRLRRDGYGTTAGLRGDGLDVFHVNEGAHVLAYHRWDSGGPKDDVVVVLNLSNRVFESYVLAFPRAGVWHVRFNADARAYAPDFDDIGGGSVDVVDKSGGPIGTVSLAPYAALILSQED